MKVNKGYFLEYRFIIIMAFALATIAMGSMFFFYDNSPINSAHNNPEYIYNTWKVEKFYKNGKLVLDNSKYNLLLFRVNKNGTAEWIKPDRTLPISFKITPDGTQIITDNGFSIEDIETIFELKKDRFRFGKRNIVAHYEYVMVPADEGK